MQPLPYLDELLSLNDKNIMEKRAKDFLSKLVIHDGYSFTNLPAYYKRIGQAPSCGSGSHRRCVFGAYRWKWTAYLPRTVHYVYEKNGIEILGAEPHATGSTYSRKCSITVKELKEKCKMNGLKTTGTKIQLLHSLMKI